MVTESPRETALILPVADAEPAVARWRLTHDPSAAQGIPAHITLLYPFRAPDELDDRIDVDLARLFAAAAPIRLTLAGICGFRNVLYLAPEPPEPLDHLIRSLMARYPDLLPYGGAVGDPVPHLTVAQIEDPAALDGVMRRFAEAAAGHLPLETTVAEVHLIESGGGPWRTRRRFPLGAGV
jgi:2'-5' RNA ligase